MTSPDLILFAVAVVGALVQTTIGVGFALILAPVAAFLRPELLPGTLILLMIPLNAWVAWRERGAIDRFGTGWISAGRTLGALLGLWIFVVLSARGLSLLIGASTILAVLASLFAPDFRPGRAAFATAGVITGITETTTGIGGPPLALVYQHTPPPVLRATVATCFLIGEILSVALLVAAGSLGREQAVATLALLPAVLLGIALATPARHRVSPRILRAAVLAFALVSGAVIMWRA